MLYPLEADVIVESVAAEFGMPDGTGRRGIVDEFEQASVAGEGDDLFGPFREASLDHRTCQA